MKKLLVLAVAALSMAACADSSTAPSARRMSAPDRGANADITCRSGYMVAYDEFGNPYCAPDASGTTTTGTATNTPTIGGTRPITPP